MWFCSILHTCVDLVWSLQWGFFIKEQISRHRWVVYGWRIDELGGCEKLILKFVGSRHGGRCGLGGGGISSWRRLCGWEGEIAFGFGCHSCGLRCLLRDSQGVLERRSRPFGVCSLQGCYRLQCPVFLCCNFWKVRETSNHNPVLWKWLFLSKTLGRGWVCFLGHYWRLKSWNAPVLQAPLAENVTQDCGAHPPDGIRRVCILSHCLPFGGTVPWITFLELFCESTAKFV